MDAQNVQERKNVYFASDAHLGLDLYGDPLEREKKLVRWLDSIKMSAREVYLVGDMFDYWFEYKDVVPKGFVRFLGKLAEMSDNGVKIYMLAGNHDIWMFDYFKKEIGATVIDGSYETVIDGKKFYIAHGDGLGDPSLSFRFMRSLFRNKFCQSLYKMFHPRITVPFGYAWSHNSRKKKMGKPSGKYLGEENEYLVKFAKSYAKQTPIDFFIFGHRHIDLDLMISTGCRVVILGDWLTHFSYGVWNGENFSLEVFESEYSEVEPDIDEFA